MSTVQLVSYHLQIDSQDNDGEWYYTSSKSEFHKPQLKAQFQIQYAGDDKPSGTCVPNVPLPTTTTTMTLSTTSNEGTTVFPTVSSTTHIQTTSSTTSTPTTTTVTSPTPSTTTTGTTIETTTSSGSSMYPFVIKTWWSDGNEELNKMDGICSIPVSTDMDLFYVSLTFSFDTLSLTQWYGSIVSSDINGQWYYLKNNWTVNAGFKNISFIVRYDLDEPNPPTGYCVINGQVSTTAVPATQSTNQRTTTTASPSTSTISSSTTSVLTSTSSVPSSTAQVSTSTTSLPSSTSSVTTSTTSVPTSSATTVSQTPSTTSSNANTKYDYGHVIGLSIKFYEAQRSGYLPASNRIPWRADSCFNDVGENGEDLRGGWYDAGDGVKFNFPMAASTSFLSWGLFRWKDAYVNAGEEDNMFDSIKWPLDYFLNCWVGGRLYGQVGDGYIDHSYWTRPEDYTMARPAFYLDSNNPGSDLAAETATALAAGSIAFKNRDSVYSELLLTKAKEIYSFASSSNRDIYTNSITNARDFYNSHSGYQDELCFGAAMLYRATNDTDYLTEAESHVSSDTAWALSWDDKRVACQLMLYEATGKTAYKTSVESFVTAYMPGGSVTRTGCGLAWRDQWGSLRYSANAAFVALMATDMGIGNGDEYKTFAMSQLHYMLGENNKNISYVIGFGTNYPKKPHHRASSCPAFSEPCDWDAHNSPDDNPHVLEGALVGGPNEYDEYEDDRTDYIKNEVACDYNAGFQSALAGLLHFARTTGLLTPPNMPCD